LDRITPENKTVFKHKNRTGQAIIL